MVWLEVGEEGKIWLLERALDLDHFDRLGLSVGAVVGVGAVPGAMRSLVTCAMADITRVGGIGKWVGGWRSAGQAAEYRLPAGQAVERVHDAHEDGEYEESEEALEPHAGSKRMSGGRGEREGNTGKGKARRGALGSATHRRVPAMRSRRVEMGVLGPSRGRRARARRWCGPGRVEGLRRAWRIIEATPGQETVKDGAPNECGVGVLGWDVECSSSEEMDQTPMRSRPEGEWCVSTGTRAQGTECSGVEWFG